MLRLKRNTRLKTMILLPNGERMKIDLDVTARLAELIRTQNDAILAAQEWVTDSENEGKRAAFYEERYRKFLETILGKEGFAQALAAYDGHVDELCIQLDGWVGDEVAPLIREASRQEMERRKRLAKKLYKRGK